MKPPLKVKAACLQFTAVTDAATNFAALAELAERAAADGAKLLATPENSDFIGLDLAARSEFASSPLFAENFARFGELAKRLKVWLLVGSLSSPNGNGGLANRSFLINDCGDTVAFYDKIHLFDFKDGEENHKESAVFTPGDKAVVATTPWGRLGLSICYDLRFAALYRSLAQRGCGILTVPSAFTRRTGEAHWRTLLRARAIENGAFVLAPAQCGDHPNRRRTWGHSLIVDPWGRVLAEAAETPTVITATLDGGQITAARNRLRAWNQRSDFTPLIR